MCSGESQIGNKTESSRANKKTSEKTVKKKNKHINVIRSNELTDKEIGLEKEESESSDKFIKVSLYGRKSLSKAGKEAITEALLFIPEELDEKVNKLKHRISSLTAELNICLEELSILLEDNDVDTGATADEMEVNEQLSGLIGKG